MSSWPASTIIECCQETPHAPFVPAPGRAAPAPPARPVARVARRPDDAGRAHPGHGHGRDAAGRRGRPGGGDGRPGHAGPGGPVPSPGAGRARLGGVGGGGPREFVERVCPTVRRFGVGVRCRQRHPVRRPRGAAPAVRLPDSRRRDVLRRGVRQPEHHLRPDPTRRRVRRDARDDDRRLLAEFPGGPPPRRDRLRSSRPADDERHRPGHARQPHGHLADRDGCRRLRRHSGERGCSLRGRPSQLRAGRPPLLRQGREGTGPDRPRDHRRRGTGALRPGRRHVLRRRVVGRQPGLQPGRRRRPPRPGRRRGLRPHPDPRPPAPPAERHPGHGRPGRPAGRRPADGRWDNRPQPGCRVLRLRPVGRGFARPDHHPAFELCPQRLPELLPSAVRRERRSGGHQWWHQCPSLHGPGGRAVHPRGVVGLRPRVGRLRPGRPTRRRVGVRLVRGLPGRRPADPGPPAGRPGPPPRRHPHDHDRHPGRRSVGRVRLLHKCRRPTLRLGGRDWRTPSPPDAERAERPAGGRRRGGRRAGGDHDPGGAGDVHPCRGGRGGRGGGRWVHPHGRPGPPSRPAGRGHPGRARPLERRVGGFQRGRPDRPGDDRRGERERRDGLHRFNPVRPGRGGLPAGSDIDAAQRRVAYGHRRRRLPRQGVDGLGCCRPDSVVLGRGRDTGDQRGRHVHLPPEQQ